MALSLWLNYIFSALIFLKRLINKMGRSAKHIRPASRLLHTNIINVTFTD